MKPSSTIGRQLALAWLLVAGAAQAQDAPADAETAVGEAAAAATPAAPVEGAPTDAKDAAPTEAKGEAPTEAKGENPTEAKGEAAAAAPDAAAAEAPATPVDPRTQLITQMLGFERDMREYQQDLGRVLGHRAKMRRAVIDARYERAVGELGDEERKRRQEAIDQFESFIGRYPDNARYTPDALFRLAELHFEKSNDAYVTALEAYDVALEELEAGRIQVAPPEPLQDYGRSVELFQRLIGQWPDDRNIDSAYYLLGYCQQEMGDPDAAREAFSTLVQRFPESRFAPETWTRIGEIVFEDGDLPAAMDAYTRVLAFPESTYFDKALYKLAWTHFRVDEYVQAIDRFRQLVEFSDERQRKTGRAASELREEAIVYLAISLQEEDWDGDGEADPEAGMARILRFVTGEKPYDVEILRALVDTQFDNARYEEMVATVQHLFASFPDDPENPRLHQRLITAYERMQRVDDAFAERSRLAQVYGDGSAWVLANAGDEEALAAAAELLEQALIQAATWHHSRAQALRKKAVEDEDGVAADEAMRAYGMAAVAYDNYLKQYPASPNAYELGYFFAECLYFADRFADAALQYASVRDSAAGEKYREPAGFSAILSHENTVRSMIEQGRLEPRPSLTGETAEPVEPPPDAENDGQVVEVVPEAIPPEVKALLSAREIYLGKGLFDPKDPERVPVVAYKTGETYFDYQHFDKAREWFSWLIERYPKTEVAGFAAGSIIDTYRRANDWKKMAEWAEIIAEAGLGRQFDEEIRTLKVGALFKEAERLFAAEQYDEAAAEYIRLVTENPGNRFADAALNNAAVAYEKTRRFESATRTYERIVREYEGSDYAQNALFRVGVNAERFYDFEKAIATHLKLVADYPDSPNRADALYQASKLQEQTGQYAAAARGYERYAKLFPSRADTAETFFRAARVYDKLEDRKNQIRIYDTFVTRYGADPAQNGRVVQGLAAIAGILEDAGRTRPARKAWQRVIDEFNQRGMAPGTFESQYPARAVFELVEDDFEAYQALQLRGSLSTQRRTLKDMQGRIRELNRRYGEVLPYKSFEWTLAAFYRLGHIYQLFAEKLYEAPIPQSLGEEEQDIYRTQLEDIALPIEDEAVKRYEQAFDKAREFRVTNIWTKRILQALNKYKPADYPLFKEERRVQARRQLSAPQLLVIPEADEQTDAPPAAAPPAGDEDEK